MKLLIFPVDVDASERFISVARSLEIPTIGASSARNSTSAKALDQLIYLPYITEPCFGDRLRKALQRHAITHVYAPHPGVWTCLKQLGKEQPKIYTYKLCHPSPYENDWLEIASSYHWAERIVADDFPHTLRTGSGMAPGRPLTKAQYAGLHKQFVRITGQCDEKKLTALANILRLTPQGDLVEIGSLSGRSAFAIAWLAERHGIGNLVSIDPWSSKRLDDQGDQAKILNNDKDRIDFEKIFSGYLCNMSLLSNAGYIRETSAQAIQPYLHAAQQGRLESPELGHVTLTGSIALLHIDGNHHYRHVRLDIDLWEPHVVSGGWVLLDDYVWAFGDGPQRAGDELLATGRFDLAFTMSDTLFLRKR